MMEKTIHLIVLTAAAITLSACSDEGNTDENNDALSENTSNMTEEVENEEPAHNDSDESSEPDQGGYSFDIDVDLDPSNPATQEALNLIEALLYPDGVNIFETGEDGYDHIRSFSHLSDRFDNVEPLIDLMTRAKEDYEIGNFEIDLYNEVTDAYFDVVVEAPLYENGDYKYALEIQTAVLQDDGVRFLEFQDVRFD
ncbi:hypothetical protein [Salisediminibacterium selenitireducens]|uniref:Lipoprotein n=1 Tax=Bacillus selenitireducens (strain ATCC 700615 / DSM 15326 / MLS10) TaxID=439292 RepID=D6XSL4_BACIE|nr:hypothetical protein [Salisediminibacterium selenitireducens]ADH98800.1 hypothetical protein Bsel_1288 [[Bacillus] selenitireducens MLS10]